MSERSAASSSSHTRVAGPPVVAVGWLPNASVSAGRDGARVVNLDTARLHDLAGLAVAVAESVTIAVPSLAHLRLAMAPARLLGETDLLIVRLDDGRPLQLWRHLAETLGQLSGLLVALEWRSRSGRSGEIVIRTTRPVPAVRLLRALAGSGDGVLTAPLRVGIADRAAEIFVGASPNVRYSGVDDTVEAGGQIVSLVDVRLEATAEARECGPVATPDDGARAVRVLAVQPADAGTELASRDADPLFVLPPVDTRVINPIGFIRDAPPRSGRCVARPGRTQATLVVGDDGAVVADVADRAVVSPGQLRDLRQLRRVQCDAEAFAGPVGQARLLSQLAAAGVPVVVGQLPPDVRHLLGAVMTDALAHVTVETTEDPLLREAASIQLRRAALWTHSAAAWSNAVARSVGLPVPAPPLVSVVLVTRRPEFLRTALQQIARQTWSRLEVVLGLHGDRFTPDAVARALRDVPQPVTVVEVPAALPYGEALNHAVAASTGTWVTKWDDDDLYGPDHVGDLLLAAAYSGATIVGKGSEYVLLEELGITVRNPGHRSERRVQWVAGGTLTCRRQTLEEVGGWRPVASSVDLALLRQVLDAGGTVYRTHGMGYILRRHRHGHTWEPGLGHFLRGDGLQWRASSPLQDVVLNTSPP